MNEKERERERERETERNREREDEEGEGGLVEEGGSFLKSWLTPKQCIL